MINNRIQLFKSSSSKKEVLEYNGISLDTYCTYCQISESLFEDNFSVELDLRFPEDETLIDVVESEKEYAVTQTQKTEPFLFEVFNDFSTAIPLEENVRLEIKLREDDKSTVVFEGKNYYVDNNCLVRNEVIGDTEYAYTQIKIWQCLAYKEPDYSSQVITIIPPGKTARILAKYDWFVKIEYNNQIMYVESDKLTDYFFKSEYDTVEIKDIINNVKDLLVNGSILKVMDEYNVYEIFRITNITANNNYTSVYARQITLEDSLRLWINDSRPTNLTGQASLEKLYTDSVGRVKELTTFSNISVNNTAYIVRKNLNEALTDGDNCFLSRWGGEIERRGYNLSILTKRGNDNNVTFRRGKNYTGIEEDVNLDNLVTRIIPIGFDGITLPDIYVDSPKINNYYNIFPAEIKFEDVKYKGSPNNSEQEGFDTLEEAYEALEEKASDYFINNQCDELKGTYNIKVVDITSTEEYKDVSIFEKTWIGDTVTIIDEKLNINLKARVSSRKYDVIQSKRIETEVTNISKKMEALTLEYLKDKIDNIQVPDMPNIQDIINQARLEAETMIRNGITNSYVVLKDNEILIMDNPDVNQAVNLLRMNKNGIAGSTTGYNGSFNLAMTIDGQIVANRITSGIMNAGVIRAGVLMSANTKTWINMENGTFNFYDKIKFDGNRFNILLGSGENLEDNLDDINSSLSDTVTSIEVLQGQITNKITSEEATSIAEQTLEGFRQEVSQTYPTNEQVVSIAQQTVGEFRQEVVQTYPTNESVSSSFADLDKKLQEQYATKTLVSQTANSITQTVSKKVGKDEIISSINQTAEEIKIKANKINLDGYTFISTQLSSPNITGNALVYIEKDGILSCDGETYATKLLITDVAKDCYFSSDAPAYFNNTLLARKGLTAGDRIHAQKGLSVTNGITVTGNIILKGYTLVKNNSLGVDENLFVGRNIEALGNGYGHINCNYLGSHGNIVALGNLSVSGSKNCVQDTENFGKRLINAYETCDYYFGDIGESQTFNGECIIWIDDIFKEIISTSDTYQVFITKYGPGDIWVSERNIDYFVVKSENDISFGWEIKGKRRGYENYRLKEFKGDEI